MKRTNAVAGAVLTLAVAAAPVAAHAAAETARLVGSIKSKGSSATLRVRYNCNAGAGSRVVVLQSKNGAKDARLAKSGGSRSAATILASTRNNFKCNSGTYTTAFKVDRKEKGTKGSLRSGYAYATWAITNGKRTIVSTKGWMKVVK